MSTSSGLSLMQAFKSDLFPIDRLDFGGDVNDFLSNIVVTSHTTEELNPGPGDRFEIGLSIVEELIINIVGLQGFSLVLGGSTTSLMTIEVSMWPDRLTVGISAGARLRFSPSMLKPVRRENEQWINDESRQYVEVGITASIIIDQDWNVSFDGTNEFRLEPVMIADSGVVLVGEIALDFSETIGLPESAAIGLPSTWRGVVFKSLVVYLPAAFSNAVPIDHLSFTNFHIGSGGVSGTVSLNDTPPTGTIGGLPFQPTLLEIELRQNCLIRVEIEGQFTLPFFDAPLNVNVGFDMAGNLSVALSSTQSPDNNINNGILTLDKPGLFSLIVESIGFAINQGVFSVILSGDFKPEVPPIIWPSFHVKELVIDSKGNVSLDGGWLDLPDQQSFSFYGFQMEVTKLGFGKTDDGGKWIGFSGSLRLIEGLSAGASVEGLRISWYDDRPTKLTLEGIGVELDIPDVLHFKGAVAYRELPGNIHRFDGRIKVQLFALDLEVDALLVIGIENGSQFFALYLESDLPAGYPLWATGLGLYGFAGLFALEMEPNKSDSEEWYENPDQTDGWYKRPQIGVSDLTDKWKPVQGSLGLGAGVTIGTLADNGFTFSGKMMLVIVFPGPIIILEGKANILSERKSLNDEQSKPLLRCLAVLDARAGSFLFSLDAHYRFASGGELIEIGGSAEVFFSFSDGNAWHIYIGRREPKERRIRAQIIKIFEANAYFMLDSRELAMGAWIGLAEDWQFGPIRAILEAWIEGNVALSWRPVHFHGDLWLHGKIYVSFLFFDIGLSVDARLAADVFDPFHLLAELAVTLFLPWPFPDIEFSITLEWGPEPNLPAIPAPLQEVSIEHLKISTKWPLAKESGLLAPIYRDGAGNLQSPRNSADMETSPEIIKWLPPPADAPVVPLDCRPCITFGRTVHDNAQAGVNAQMVWKNADPEGFERIGDPKNNEGPVRVSYALSELVLENWNTTTFLWEIIASAGNANLADRLWGSWAPVPQLPSGDPTGNSDPPIANNKLLLWSKSGFDYTRSSGRSWDEWFTDRFPGYPCVAAIPEREICFNFESLTVGEHISSPWRWDTEPGISVYWIEPVHQTVVSRQQTISGLTNAICFPSTREGGVPGDPVIPNFVTIELPAGISAVHIIIVDQEGVEAIGYDAQGNSYGPFFGGRPGSPRVDIAGTNLVQITLRGSSVICLFQICVIYPPDPGTMAERDRLAQHMVEEIAHWQQTDSVLEPDRDYRLRIVTTVEAFGEEELEGWEPSPNPLIQTQFAFFHTQGPPGLTNLSLPAGIANSQDNSMRAADGSLIQVDGTPAQRSVLVSELNSLTPYVQQTVPPTVPSAGQNPPLPRPVYRAYDTGVQFNENYVELMYKAYKRSLGLYLYDNNNQPVRDAEGRVIAVSNNWGNTAQLRLEESEQRWITTVNTNGCAGIDTSTIVHDQTLTAAGQVLEPDTLYEGRLIPLLLEEDFNSYPANTIASGSNGTFGGWLIIDQGLNQGPSHWGIGRVGSVSSLNQDRSIWGGSLNSLDPVKPGTMLVRSSIPGIPPNHPQQPAKWTDYRLIVVMRNADDDAFGLVFRYQDSSNYYRFSMDRQHRYRRLVRVVQDIHTILAEDNFVYQVNSDYIITVEAIGSSLRLYQDEVLIFAVLDESLSNGSIGLYCYASAGVSFSHVRMDDFRLIAPAVFKYQFTTSLFTDFFHQLHSYQDETWLIELPIESISDNDFAAILTRSVNPATQTSENEVRAYDQMVTALNRSLVPNPQRVEVNRIERNGRTVAFWVHTSEPLDWMRTELTFQRLPGVAPAISLPGIAKLTKVAHAAVTPNEESVDILLRESVNPSFMRVEKLGLPNVLAETEMDSTLFEDSFSRARGLLFREDFGPNALDRYTIIDHGNNLGPSAWKILDGQIVQTSNIYGGPIIGSSVLEPGTIALIGSTELADITIHATFRSENNGAIGIIFRYQDESNYYRFSMDRRQGVRLLMRCVDGEPRLLWQNIFQYNLGQSYSIEIHAWKDQLLGFLDNVFLFSVGDTGISNGRIGFYCRFNNGAYFESLSVESIEVDPVLWQSEFSSTTELEIIDASNAIQGPSVWMILNGIVSQTSNIHVVGNNPARGGSFAIIGDDAWEDVQISLILRSSDNDAIGVMFRYINGDNYYRFSMDAQNRYRRLIRMEAGITTVLWEDQLAYLTDRDYHLTLRAEGSILSGFLDGVALFLVLDAFHARGRVAFYCSANNGATFRELLVLDIMRRLGSWSIRDDESLNLRSRWKTSDGALLQNENTFGGNISAQSIEKPGTCAIAGSAGWQDYTFQITLRSDDPAPIGVIFRYIDNKNYYRFSMDSLRRYRRLVRNRNGIMDSIYEDSITHETGRPVTIVIDAIRDRLKCHIDGVLVFDLRDPTHATGRIGVYCWGNSGARFDRALVRRPSLEAYALFSDRFTAGDLNGWIFIDEGLAFAPSAWSIANGELRQTSNIYEPPNDRATLSKLGTQGIAGDPGWRDVIFTARLHSVDNDSIGVLFRYNDAGNYYRFSMDSERRYRRLVKNVNGTFASLWEDEFSNNPNQTYEIIIVVIGSIIQGFIDGVPMFIVTDSDLTAGSIGLYCWANQDARFSNIRVYPADRLASNWLLTETFNSANPERWTFVDQTSGSLSPNWQFVPGELQHRSNAFGGRPGADHILKNGTFAVAGDETWSDYRLIVHMRSDSINSIGVMFRYRNERNYYRFSMDNKLRYRMLVKFNNGRATELWADNFQFEVGREYLLTIDCLGPVLSGFLDGVQLFNLEDADFSSGGIALYCWRNNGARFFEVRVAQPGWSNYYSFNNEMRMPAGTRIRVYAGHSADAHDSEPRILRRFIAGPGESGRIRFNNGSVTLRLNGSQMDQWHQRSFQVGYIDQIATVLRKRDGTSFIILPVDQPINESQYRLGLTYRRDITRDDPDSQVLSENGDTTDEVVWIDVP